MIYQLLPREAEFRTLDPGTGLVTAFDHYGYRVDDLGEASAFFAETVGMIPLVAATAHDRGTSEAFYGFGADVLKLEADGPAGLSHIALRVDDLDHALAADAESCTAPAGPSAEVVPRPGAPWIRRPGRRVGDPHRRPHRHPSH